MHPDLAGDPSERDDRSRQMIQVNDLYARRELGELKQLLRKVRGEQSRRAENPRQRRMRLKDEQTRLEASIKRLKAELAELNHSPMMALKLECALARSRGRDVLAEMAVQMTAQLEEAEGELSALIQTFRELAESSGLADNG